MQAKSRLLLLGLMLAHSHYSSAVELSAAPLVGLMQQPSSQYYHAVYGGALALSTSNSLPVVRASYWERPKFDSQGFIDQEYSFSLTIGGKIWSSGNFGVGWYLGGGGVQGFIAASGASGESNAEIARYSLRGFTQQMEFKWSYGSFFLGAVHEFLVGIVSEREVEAYVAWPFQTSSLSMGWVF